MFGQEDSHSLINEQDAIIPDTIEVKQQQNDYEISNNDNGITSDTVEVTGEGLDNIDALECYFEGETSGGGKEKEVEAIKNIADGIVHVKFVSVEGNLNTAINN